MQAANQASTSDEAAPEPGAAQPRGQRSVRGLGSFSAGVFRENAIRAYLSGTGLAQVLQANQPRGGVLLSGLFFVFVLGLVLSVFGRVDIVANGRGTLRELGDRRALSAAVPGTVEGVFARSGERVETDRLILTVHSPELERQLFEARSRHRLAVEALVTYDKEVAPLQLKRQELLEIQLRLARQALGHQRSSLGDVNAGLARQRRLVGAGVESQNSLFQYEFLRDRSLQERAGVEREGSAAELQSASLAVERAAERLTLERNVKESEALLAALEHRDSSRQVLAPQGGRVESIVVQPGEHLEAGTPVATLLTSERLGPAIAFLPERDRAFVRSGDRVELELDQLPAREFGRLEARVVRVSSDLASVAELRDAFGESSGGDSTGVAGPMYRVELTLVQSERLSRLSARMRSGMLFNARFVLRNRRVISLVLDPIRNW